MYDSLTKPLSLLKTIQPGLIQYVGTSIFLSLIASINAVLPLIPSNCDLCVTNGTPAGYSG
nr:MAG TPA: hypothetical protein [Caudoviricetes sp.]